MNASDSAQKIVCTLRGVHPSLNLSRIGFHHLIVHKMTIIKAPTNKTIAVSSHCILIVYHPKTTSHIMCFDITYLNSPKPISSGAASGSHPTIIQNTILRLIIVINVFRHSLRVFPVRMIIFKCLISTSVKNLASTRKITGVVHLENITLSSRKLCVSASYNPSFLNFSNNLFVFVSDFRFD